MLFKKNSSVICKAIGKKGVIVHPFFLLTILVNSLLSLAHTIQTATAVLGSSFPFW